MTAWYDWVVENSREVYALFQNDMVPSVTATYQQIVADVTDAGLQTIQYDKLFGVILKLKRRPYTSR